MLLVTLLSSLPSLQRGADKSLVRPASKQANVSVRTARISFGALPCRERKLDDSSRLDVVEIARVPDMLSSLFPSWSDYGLIATYVNAKYSNIHKVTL